MDEDKPPSASQSTHCAQGSTDPLARLRSPPAASNHPTPSHFSTQTKGAPTDPRALWRCPPAAGEASPATPREGPTPSCSCSRRTAERSWLGDEAHRGWAKWCKANPHTCCRLLQHSCRLHFHLMFSSSTIFAHHRHHPATHPTNSLQVQLQHSLVHATIAERRRQLLKGACQVAHLL